jgi:DNA-binding NarL/FixJ family response regulator
MRNSLLRDVIEAALVRSGCFDLVASTDDDTEANELIRQEEAEIVVVDGDAEPAGVIAERIGRLAATCARIVCLVSSSDHRQISIFLHAGALSCVAKSVPADDLAAIVRQASRGAIFHSAAPPAPGRGDGETGAPPLTGRELEILALVSRGQTNKQVAANLWVTEQTVKFHLTNSFRKLGVMNRTEAVIRAQGLRLIEFPPVI